MTRSPRIAFIGAGSVEFTRQLVGDLLSYRELREVTLSLHDIDEERLATAAAVARVTALEAGAEPAIEAHEDRRRALDGADYAINMIQVGGHAATVLDHEIPSRYGLRQTIGDTLGIGGIFRALRTIPVMQGIAADMADVCPDAWLLNYTNPMAMLCWATYAGTPQRRVVGLCHSVQNTTRQLSEYVGVPFEDVTFLGAGVNHQAWILRFERDGEDLYPLLDMAIERDPQLRRHVRVELYRRLGCFPTESSEHSAEYLPWIMRDDDGDRVLPPHRRRVRPAQPGDAAGVRGDQGAARRRQATADRAERRVRAADHPFDRDGRAADHLRQRREHGADRQPARRRLRRGAVPR